VGGVGLDRGTGGGKPTLQFAGEQQVGQRGLTVGQPRGAGPGCDITPIERDLADTVSEIVAIGRNIDHSELTGLFGT